MAVDNDKLMEFVGSAIGDLGATLAAGGVVIGHRLGLYTALAQGPATPEQLAERTGCHPRYLTEWLRGQAAGGYVGYEPASGTFAMSEEQAFALTDPAGPLYLPGAFLLALASLRSEPRITEAFRTGEGMGWHEHDEDLFTGCELFFRPGYLANLTTSWIPALDGVEAKLAAGATVADIGCGLGASSLLMAQAYPRASIVGSDYHDASIELARKAAVEAGVGDRVQFDVASAQTFAGSELRPGDLLRLPARHGRPAGRGPARARGAGAGRDLDGGRARGRRPRRGQSEPGRPGVLLGVDAAVRAERAVAAGRLRARCAGRRGGDPAAGHRRRVHAVPARGRDAVQHRLRGPSLRCSGLGRIDGSK